MRKATAKGKLIQMRTERGLTQQQLATRLKVDDAMISRYEHGQAMPTFWVFIALRGVLGVTTDALVNAFLDAHRRRQRIVEQKNGKAVTS